MRCPDCKFVTRNKKSFSNHIRYGCPNTPEAEKRSAERIRILDRKRYHEKRKFDLPYKTKRKEQNRKYYLKNKRRFLELHYLWRKRNPEQHRAELQRRKQRNSKRVSLCIKCNVSVLRGTKRVCKTCKRLPYLRNQFWRKVKNYQRGERHHNWKGGRTALREKIRGNPRYRRWRTSIFERDNYTCVLCLSRNGNGTYVRLEADHFPISFSDILDRYSITTWEKAEVCEFLWNITNGRTLCVKCHNKTKHGNPRHKKDP